MKHRLRLLSAFLFLVLTAVCQFETAKASTISYSWAGHLRLIDDVSPDPWQIGEDGAKFRLETIVSADAVDQNETQVPFASFAAISARLWVDGEEVLFLGDAYIDIVDTVDIFDFATTGGLFSMFGQTLEISSVVGLDASSFSLNLVSETPPLFYSTITATIGEVINHPYVTTVSIGTHVTVVPEPNTLLIVIGQLTSMVFSLHRNFRK